MPWLLAAAALAIAGQTAQPAGPAPAATINKYCVTCHNDRLKRGDLVLDKLDPDNVGANVETWEKVVKKLDVVFKNEW